MSDEEKMIDDLVSLTAEAVTRSHAECAARIEELEAEIERVRQNHGCARHQRTTQYCADLEACMKERDEYKRRLDDILDLLKPVENLRSRHTEDHQHNNSLREMYEQVEAIAKGEKA